MIAAPKLVSMHRARAIMSPQGQPMVPLVSADLDDTAAALLSGGVVHMAPAHAARAHVHRETDVIVLLWRSGAGGALTLFGDRLENEIWQRPRQALWIPRGVPHAAINPSRSRSIIAFEFRSNPVLGEDNRLLPELEPIVRAYRDNLHRRGTRACVLGGLRRFWLRSPRIVTEGRQSPCGGRAGFGVLGSRGRHVEWFRSHPRGNCLTGGSGVVR